MQVLETEYLQNILLSIWCPMQTKECSSSLLPDKALVRCLSVPHCVRAIRVADAVHC